MTLYAQNKKVAISFEEKNVFGIPVNYEGDSIFIFRTPKNPREITFQKTADFSRSKFLNSANFLYSKFQDTADFSEAKFLSNSDFSDLEFLKTTDFSFAVFQKKVGFYDTRFKGIAKFSYTQFNDTVGFASDFENTADFSRSTFRNVADFNLSSFRNIANFSKLNILPSTHLRFFNTKFPRLIDFSDNEKIFFDVVFSAGDFHEGPDPYSVIQRNFIISICIIPT